MIQPSKRTESVCLPGVQVCGLGIRSKRRLSTAAMIVFLLLGSTVNAQTTGDTECLLDKYARYVEAQREWQRTLRDLVSQEEPQFADVAFVYMSEQLLYIDERARAVEYFLNNEANRLQTGRNVGEWLDLDSAARDRMAVVDERYAELRRLGDAVRDRPPHPDGDGLRQAMRDRIMNQSEYQNLLRAFVESVQQINQLRCP